MADIHDININDIRLFISKNVRKSSKDDIYKQALNLIKSGKAEYYPDSIIAWMMAYNLLKSKTEVPFYNKNEILQLSEKDTKTLAKLLGMRTANKEHMMNILSYMHRLKLFIGLPDVDKQIIENLGLKELKEIMKGDEYIINLVKTLYPDISDVLKVIDKHKKEIVNIVFSTRVNGKDVQGTETKVYNDLSTDIIDLSIRLLKEKKVHIVQKILDYYFKKDKKDYNYFTNSLLGSIFNPFDSLNKADLESYFMLDINDINVENESTLKDNLRESLEDYIKHFNMEDFLTFYINILRSAIIAKNRYMIDFLTNFYEDSREMIRERIEFEIESGFEIRKEDPNNLLDELDELVNEDRKF